jgi:hypothetical protein
LWFLNHNVNSDGEGEGGGVEEEFLKNFYYSPDMRNAKYCKKINSSMASF